MRVNARDLTAGDFIRGPQGTGTIAEMKVCNESEGKPPILIGGYGLKTACAIRITLTDGTSFLAHPNEEILRTIDTEQSTILPFANT